MCFSFFFHTVICTTKPVRRTWTTWSAACRCIPGRWSTWWRRERLCTRLSGTEQIDSTLCFFLGTLISNKPVSHPYLVFHRFFFFFLPLWFALAPLLKVPGSVFKSGWWWSGECWWQSDPLRLLWSPELLNFLMKILKLLMNLFCSSFRKASLPAVLPQLCGFEFWVSSSVNTFWASASDRQLLMSTHRDAGRNETKTASVKDGFSEIPLSYVINVPEAVKTWASSRINWWENDDRQSSFVQTCISLCIYDQAICPFISLISHFKPLDKGGEFWTVKLLIH